MAERETTSDPWAPWRTRIESARKRRDEVVPTWQENVDARKGALGLSTPGADSVSRLAPSSRVYVNQDWPLTKAKIAQLYSQTPEVRLSPRFPEFQAAVQTFSRELNDTIADAGVGGTIEEILADVVNASGIGGVICYCETRTEPREVPLVDPAMLPPEAQAQVMSGALELPMTTVDHPVDRQHLAQRISPPDLLIPSDFTGSNYDHARWLGHEGRMTWAQAVIELGLTDEQKEKVLSSDKRSKGTTNTLNSDSAKFRDDDVVSYQQIFYWRHFYHEDETSFKALQRLVFVDGLDEPVINEPYRAQKRGEDGRMLGVTRNPIRILTVTYISDDCLPPSDSTISRFDVDELTDFRDSERQQRKHSTPWRWFDSNRVSPNTRAKLEAGTIQGFIPTNGPGDRAIGEVARASYPPERYRFEDTVKNDLTEKWQVGTNQAGAFASGERSASEAKIIQQNFNTRVGQERDKVTKFFLGIAEVLAGHLALYGTFDVPDQLGVQREALSTGFTYSVRSDSTVRLDAQQRIEQLERAINFLAQSPYANAKPLLDQYAELNDLPAGTIIDPQPKAPEPVKVSVSKAEDLMNPLFLALLNRTKQGPMPEDVEAAKRQLASLGMPTIPLPPTAPAEGGPPRDSETPGIANADWQAAARMERRDEDGGA